MRRYALGVALGFAFSINWCAGAQQDTPAARGQHDQAKETKKVNKTNSATAADDLVFSEAVANRLLSELRAGLEGHSQRRVLSAFDRDKMDGYVTFEDQIEAMMQRYDPVRVHFRIAQSTTEGPRGVALVEFEMEEIPRSGGAAIRRNGQVKFEMERGRKGWKIVDFSPRGFFS